MVKEPTCESLSLPRFVYCSSTEHDHQKQMCKSRERTRTGKKFSQQQLQWVDKASSRVGDVPKGWWICLSHRKLILANDKCCSCWSLQGHSKKAIQIPILKRLYTVIDEVGRNNRKNVINYDPWTKWCYVVASQLQNLFTPKTKERDIRKYGKPP